MGMINEFFVVPDELIKKRIKEEFDIYDYIQKELILFHEYKDLPFWRDGISFGTNKGWNATQEILNQLDQSEDKILKRITYDDNKFLSNQFFKLNTDVEKIWEYLKRISIAEFHNFIKVEINRKKIEEKEGYRMHWVNNQSAMVENFMEILNAYYNAVQRKEGIINELE